MRQNLEQLVAELQQTKAAKADYLVTPRNGSVVMENGELVFADSGNAYHPTKVFHENLTDKLKIPRAYYERMQYHAPGLLDKTVNTWLRQLDNNAMVRTYEFPQERVARAFLSDSYKVIDNYDVLFAALEAIQTFCKKEGVKVDFEDCALTDRRMYVRMTCPDIQAQAKDLLKAYKNPKTGEGNPYVITGLQLTNSEVGQGAFQLMPRAVILACKNGMTRKDDAFRKVHLGAKLDDETNKIKWSESTLKKNLNLIVSQVKDAVQEFLSKEYLIRTINYYTNKGSIELKNPIPCIQNITQELGYSEERKSGILDYFVKSGDFTRFGAVQALTFDAHEQADADEMFEAENNAFNIFESIGNFDKVNMN